MNTCGCNTNLNFQEKHHANFEELWLQYLISQEKHHNMPIAILGTTKSDYQL